MILTEAIENSQDTNSAHYLTVMNGDNINAYSNFFHLSFPALHILTQTTFCQDDDRCCTALPCNRNVPFHSAQIEVPVKSHTQKYRVYIGGHHLLLIGSSCCFPDKNTLSGQYLMNHGLPILIRRNKNKITHCRIIRNPFCFISELTGNRGLSHSVFRNNIVHPSFLRDHTGMEPLRRACDTILESVIPAPFPKICITLFSLRLSKTPQHWIVLQSAMLLSV